MSDLPADDPKAKLEETRQRVRNLTVLGLDGSLSPQQMELVRNLERSARAETKLRQKAAEHSQQSAPAQPRNLPDPINTSLDQNQTS
jgi:hypothetical protein